MGNKTSKDSYNVFLFIIGGQNIELVRVKCAKGNLKDVEGKECAYTSLGN